MPEPVCWPRPKDSCCLEFSLHMQADHNREGLSVKDHISYTRKSSRSYVALDAATKEEAGDGSYGLQGETLLNLYKGLSRDLSASRLPARPRDRTPRRERRLARPSALRRNREHRELRLQSLALALRALGFLFAEDQRLERVLAFLADVLKDGHEENSAKKTAVFYLKSKRGYSANTRRDASVHAAPLVARRTRANGCQLSNPATLPSACARRTADRSRARHPGVVPLSLAGGSRPSLNHHHCAWSRGLERLAVHARRHRKGSGRGNERDSLQPAQLRRHRRARSRALSLGVVAGCGSGGARGHRPRRRFAPSAGWILHGRQYRPEAGGGVGIASAAAVSRRRGVLSGN